MRDPALSILAAALLTSATPEPGELRRRADWGFRIAADSSGASVSGLRQDSAAGTAGLRAGDRILTIEGMRLDDPSAIASARRRSRGGDRIQVRIVRGGRTETLRFTLAPLPEERITGCEVRYGSLVTAKGDRVRTVLTRPRDARGRLPTVLFIPWLSCDAVEGDVPGDGWMQLLRGIAARSGWALYRVEKPGVGDSEGPDCAHNDLEADLAAFRVALDDVSRRPDVDPDRIVLFGGSIGGALAPILARSRPVAGIIVSGGFSRTWLEHMLEIERTRLAFEGLSAAELNRAMRGFADFYSLYLNQGLTPAQVLARRPDLAPLWYDGPEGQYGRPAAYYQQVQRLNVEEAWSMVEVPVLVLRGEYDWIMSPAESHHAVEIVNARHPGLATLVTLPRTDHNLGVYESPLAAYRDSGGSFDGALIDRVIAWLHESVPSPAQRPH